MEIKHDCKQNLVKMGMVDFKLADAFYFETAIDNIFPALRSARTQFLRNWMRSYQFLERHPVITVFFVVYDDEWVFVRDKDHGCKENCYKLILDHSALQRPGDVLEECLRTYGLYCRACEIWREKRVARFHASAFKTERIKLEFDLIRGGKE